MIDLVGLDGDDTLWHNENRFAEVHGQFADLLAPFAQAEDIDTRLVSVERANLRLFGYGVKGFTLSMVETAIEVSDGQIDARTIHRIIAMGKALLDAPVELLDGVADTVAELAGSCRLVLITKGDLFNQEAKVSASGLADLFWRVEIVSEKDPATYARVLAGADVDASRFVMAGNSLRSDVLPVLALGGRAVHVPYPLTWALERVPEHELAGKEFAVADTFSELPAILSNWAAVGRSS